MGAGRGGVSAEQLLEAWGVNNRVNLMLLDAISPAGMKSTLSTRGGRDVARQFAHMHNVRVQWLEVSAKDLAGGLTKFDTEDSPAAGVLKKNLKASADAIGALIDRSVADGGKVKSYKRGVATMLGYFIAHEGHHRGSILLTLKQTGNKVPSEVQWGIWDWGKI